MTTLERLIHRGYYDAADGEGNDLPGDGRGDTLDVEDENDVEGAAGDADKDGKDADDDADKDGEDKPAKKPTGIMIPKERFDTAVKKARDAAEAAIKRADEAEAKLKADLGAKENTKLETELDELEEALEGAIADGNVEKKKAIRTEIRKKNQELADIRAQAHATRASAIAIEQVRYDATVERIEAEHPELNPDSAEFDDDLFAEALELKEAFEAKGHSSSEALKKAVGVVFRGAKAPAKAAEDDDAGEEEKEAREKAEKLAAERKAAAVKKGLEAKGKQPADTKKAGRDSDAAGKTDKIDPAKLSDAEFDKLTPEQLKKLRGDTN
jgi:colicin import membrane protein